MNEPAHIPPLPPKPPNLMPVWLAALLAVLWLIVRHLDISFVTLINGVSDMAEYIGRFSHPDFSALTKYLELMGVTLVTALWGTLLAGVAAFILAPLAARNFTPHPALYRATRELLSLMRAMPDLLLALLFVNALGLGPLPGVFALGIHTAGFLGKFFAECMERIDRGVVEGVAATGANLPQRIMYAAWPSIRREATGYTLYIVDRNVRMASVLGLVGGGGIGLELQATLRLFNYDQSSALIVVLVVTILAIDYLSSWLREKVS